MRQGFLNEVLRIMDIAGRNFTEVQCIAVLTFDEMKIKSIHEYDIKADEILGAYSQMQVVIARRLFMNWKQPIYGEFDQKITKDIILKLIKMLHNIGYTVVACTCDMSGANRGLWKELGINQETPWIKHPETEEHIYFLTDVPHLLKLIRNCLLDTGFILSDGSIIHKDPLIKLIECDNGEYQACPKLKEIHIMCEKSQRPNIKLAA